MPTASGSLAFLGAARFQGYWDASTNNATGSGLTGGVTGPVNGLFLTGTSTSTGGYALATGLSASAGDYWQVTGSGTHSVDGTTSWALNDFCIYSGSAGGTGDWIKLAFEDTIASIVLGDLSSASFHLGAENDKHIIFATGSVHSGSNNFIFDYTNNRVGIGTTSPETLAHIQNGSAGTIATTDGALLTLESNEKPKIHFQSPGAYGGSIVFGSPTDNDEGQIDYDHGSDRFLFKTGGSTKMAILGNNVGIGTTAPLNTLSVTGTLGVSGDTAISGDVRVADDKKLFLGAADDAHIEYNEDGDDNLIISGSSAGMVLSGTMVQVSGNVVVKFPNYLAVTSNDSHNASSFYVQTGQGAQFHGGVDNAGVTIRDAGDVHIADDKKIIFGTGEDSHIEYNENGDDFLIVSGSAKGLALSGSTVSIDGAVHANAGISGLHQLTGSLQITGSDGVSLQLKSTGSVSFRLEADTDNSDETQNPFIELIQDGGSTDFTIGLTKLAQSPEGASINSMADNSLAIGSNTDTTNATHVQFYLRNTASFSLIDKGSTNHSGLGGPVDLQGFRVGIGPGFDEGNFPKGRMEIHNTSTSPVPALYLAVSGTAQPALIADTANTTRNVVEISGSSLTTGDLMHLYSDSSNTSDRSLLKVTNDNASSEKVTLIELKQDAFSYPAFIQRGGGTVKNLPTFNTSLANNQVIAVTHLVEGTYFAVGRDAGKTDTTATSAQIVARIKDATVGDSFSFAYLNISSNAVTLAGGTNVLMLDGNPASFAIPAGKGRSFAFVLMNVGSGTEQVNMIPKSDVFDLYS
ncbi:MAG: hypothetical protein CL554_21710 [Algoriphagus sp.]|uniref:hypothetical protein n=1 Tax=Algoriphagus sp. TaxID=1872435 RepID=UPI000C4ACAC6|nr:hypothetical protein [Algoriphagus sp.]MAL16028.1 hypothetical protein [Algoriphagus sp.]